MKRYTTLFLLIVIAITLRREWGSSSHNDHLHSKLSRVRQVRRYAGGIWKYRSWPGWDGITRIYAFGDSHTDTGFDPDGYQPSLRNPLGNPAWPGRTGNYGPNYIGHLTGTFNSNFIDTYNLARADTTLQKRPALDDTIISLEEQIDELFLPRYGRSQGGSATPDSSSKWRQDDTLFVFFAGPEDIMAQYLARDGYRNRTDAYLDTLEYQRSLNKIYDYGARNFLIVGYPAQEESPRIRNCGIKSALTQYGAELVDRNGRLAFAVQDFSHDHPDATIFFFDNLKLSVNTRKDVGTYPETSKIQRQEGYCYFYADKRDVIENDPACMNDLSEFYWRDDIHHTEPYHRLMARLMVEHMKELNNALPYEFY